MAQLGVNLTDYDVQEGFDVLPPGWYTAEIVDSEIRNGKSSGKPYVQWVFQIDGKPNKVWTVTSIGNDVSMRILKTMAHCCGHKNPNYIQDTEELHGRRCQVKLAIEKDDNGDYEAKNVIKAFKPIEKSQTAGVIPAGFPAANIPIASSPAIAAPPVEKAQQQRMPWDK